MTQSILTITENNKVIYKVICGCNGGQIFQLSKKINKSDLKSLARLYQKSKKFDLGCKKCLVVMNNKRTFYKGDEPLSRRYRKTFNAPKFNPRWDIGLADHIIVIKKENVNNRRSKTTNRKTRKNR